MAFAPALALAGSAASGLFGFLGAQQQGEASAASNRYQAQVYRNNQIIAANNAQYATQAGGVRAQTQDFKNRAVQGQIEAQQGASGIDLGSQTSADVRAGAKQVGRLDTESIYNNALLSANQSLAQASSAGAQAGLSDFAAKNAQSAGTMAGLSSLIGSASSFGDKWLRYQNAGVPGYGSIF